MEADTAKTSTVDSEADAVASSADISEDSRDVGGGGSCGGDAGEGDATGGEFGIQEATEVRKETHHFISICKMF